MYEDSSGLRELFDNKTAKLKNKALYEFDYSCSEVLPTVDSTFLGPILWEDTLPISDLDNINLEDFSPELLERSASAVQTVENSYAQNNDELGKVLDLDPISQPQVNLTWDGTPPKPANTAAALDMKSVSPPARKKSSIPMDQRNEKYWSRRMKNNASAKRSRDARRMMENQVHMKADALERENEQLRLELMTLVEENKKLRDLLHQSNIRFPPPAVIYSTGPTSTDASQDASPYSSVTSDRSGFIPSIPFQSVISSTSCPSPSFCWNLIRNDCCQ